MGVKVRQLAGSDYKVKCLNKFYSLSYVDKITLNGEEKE